MPRRRSTKRSHRSGRSAAAPRTPPRRTVAPDLRAEDLDRLFNMALDMMCVADTQGYFTRVNPAFERTLGYAAHELTAAPFLSFVHPEDRPATAAELAKIASGLDTLHFENRYRCRDGSYRWFAWTARAPRPGEDVIYGVARDVTEQKLAADRARRHEAELAHLARRITAGEMTTGLAHELNQPLTAIGNYAAGCLRRLRARGSGGERQLTHALEHIRDETARAGGIIDSLRRLVRKRDPARATVDLNRLVRDMCEFLRPEAAQARIQIVTDLCGGLLPVTADGVQIEQVILNLLRNAVESLARDGGRRRFIKVSSRATRDGAAEVCVHDSGPGLAPAVADRVFEPFFTTKPDGLGMGLKIGRTIVESHGGRIAIGPARRGAKFVVRLPLARPPRATVRSGIPDSNTRRRKAAKVPTRPKSKRM